MKRILIIAFLAIPFFSMAQSVQLSELKPVIIPCTPVKDQYLSSTCWSFAGNSLLESELLRKGIEVDLSEMFVARYSLLRKIDRHLKLKGTNFFTPGGQFHDLIWVIKNHGMVPESAYSGKGRNELNHNHSELDTLLSHYVKNLVAKGVTELSNSQQQYIDSVLDHYLGIVPKQFNYKGTIYTPYSFAERVLEFNAGDYVEITSYTHHPFYKSFALEDKYNWTGDAYYNVPLDDFSRITDQALNKGYTVGWDGDATDPGFNYPAGMAWMTETAADQTTRQQAFKDKSTELDHVMHIVGSTKDTGGKTWYYIKNSWGTANPFGGYLFMREDYFRIRTVAIIVNKNAIPADIRSKLGI